LTIGLIVTRTVDRLIGVTTISTGWPAIVIGPD
jgi:hypothetical protein